MGLVYPQAVKVKVSRKYSKYYQNKGYNIPMRMGTRKKLIPDTSKYIYVAIDDLTKSSAVKLWYKCDCCCELNYISKANYTSDHTNPIRPLYCKKCSKTGLLNGKWNPNITDEERNIKRQYKEYSNFVKRVLARDNYTCQVCDKKSHGNLIVHHLNGYNWDKEHRTDDTNGITLCTKCHENFHSLYGVGNNTKEQFEEWVGHRVKLTHYFGEIYSLPKVYCLEDNYLYNDKFEAAKKLGCNPATILSVCKGIISTYHGKHFVYYEKYLQMSQNDITTLLSKGIMNYRDDKRVLCINNGNIYNRALDAARYFNYKHASNIYNACNGLIHSAGRYNNQKLQWMWYTDFISLPSEQQIQIVLNNKETLQEGSFLYDLLNNQKTKRKEEYTVGR